MTRYLPIIAPTLDPRNEFSLANEAKLRVVQASNKQITDISSGSVVSALMEGFAFSQAELLYFLNQMPETYTAVFLSQILGIQIISSEPSTVVLEFIRDSSLVQNNSYLLSTGFQVLSTTGIVFETLSPVNFNKGESIKYVLARSTTEGSVTNVSANSVNSALSGNSQFSSINNPSPSYGGKDGESYNEAKARAFSQIKRRNPTSMDDFAELVEDILGTGTRVKVSAKSSSPLTQLGNGQFIAPESDANILIESIINKKRSLGQEPVLSERDINIITASLSNSYNASEHIFISVRANDGLSIDQVILDRVRLLLQNRAPLGITVHLQNALTQVVDIEIVLQNNNSVSDTSQIESIIEAYFDELTFGSNLDYSSISSVVSGVTNVLSITATTGAVIENEGLSSESIIDNVVVSLSKNGVVIFNRGLSETFVSSSNSFYSQTDSYPAYANSVIWKLGAVDIRTSAGNTGLNPVYGTLLECKGEFTSVRSDGSGGTYFTANDRSCGYLVDEDQTE